MPLDTASAAFLDILKAAGRGPLSEAPIAESRANMAAGAALGALPAPVDRTEHRDVDTPAGRVALRIYWPVGAAAGQSLPAVLQFHGGGFVLGNLDSHDAMCRHYCANAHVIVVSVDYHLAPEAKFPTQVEDAYAALCWVASHAPELGVDASRVGVTGDSAGGNLATVLCAVTRERGGPRVACQALLYPVTDFRLDASYPSVAEFGAGDYFLSAKDMEWFRAMYLANVTEQAHLPHASPMAAASLAGLPPALVTTAGCDPLRDEGRAYARRLAEAGVPVEHRSFDSTIHACASFAGAVPAGLEMLNVVSAWLKRTLHTA